MAQATEEELNQQQPGAPQQPQQDDQDKQLEEMKKMLAEKDAQLTEMKKKIQLEEMKKMLAEKDAQLTEMKKKLQDKDNQNDDNTTSGGTADGGNHDQNESKMPPKTDVTLSLRGIPEYDQYPYSMQADKFYFMASIKAPYFRSEQRAPIDLVAVVDESGSMSGDRIKLVKETVQFIIKNLESNDRFGIVGYSSGSRIVLPLTKMDDSGKKTAQSLANGLRASGGTALCAGLVQGVNMMRSRTFKNDVASVMILTDGQANNGPTSAQQINASVISGKIGGNKILNYQQQPMYQQQGYAPKQRKMKMNKRKNKIPTKTKKMQRKPQQIQQQMIPQQQMQQQINISPQGMAPQTVDVTPKDMIEDDEKQNEGNTKTSLNDNELPCTINTFGFGKSHNESLLESIAENGRGMYAFIENTDMIADTFAECLGGLVSIIGQNLKIQVEALNDVEINKCLSTGYTLTVTKPRKIHTISINNLQSEENRDLIFELKVPKRNGGKKENDPIIQLSVKYKNVVKDKEEVLSNVSCINRIDGTQIGERNIELDVQYNRVLAAEAMEKADELANNGKLEEARKILTSTQEHIKKSKSNKAQFSKNLVNDISTVMTGMQSKQQYRATGGKMLKMNKKAHKMQRSVQSSAYQSQSVYQNRSKSSMKKKFKSSK